MQHLLKQAGQALPPSKPVFEINPEHPLVERMKTEQDDEQFSEWAKLLFDQALLAEGGQLEDPASFVHRLNQIILDISA